MELHDRIKKARKDAGLTQDELAIACGVKGAAVSQWESSDPEKRTKPKYPSLEKIAEVTGRSAQWLLSGGVEEDQAIYMSVAKVPVISWPEAKNTEVIKARYTSGDGEWLDVPSAHSKGAYALQLLSSALPGFSPGEYLVVSPVGEAKPDHYVVASVPGLPEPILVKVIAIGGALYLEATAAGLHQNVALADAQVHGLVTLAWRVLAQWQ